MLIKVERLDVNVLEPTDEVSGSTIPYFDSIKEDLNDDDNNIKMDIDGDHHNNDDDDDDDDEDYDDDDFKPISQLTTVKKKRIKKSLASHHCNVCSKFFQKKHCFDAHMRAHKGLKVSYFILFLN